MKTLKTLVVSIVVCLAAVSLAAAQNGEAWRKMSPDELKKAVPERAPVIEEKIETELRTASGITDGIGKTVFGAIIITAGYEAEGKYTHYFKTDTAFEAGELRLEAGEYVFGYRRIDGEHLLVLFYKAADGELVGAVKAKKEAKKAPIYSLLIEPPLNGKGKIRIGRFVFDYNLATK